MGGEHDPLPIGQWKITSVQHDPWFNYDPVHFWNASPEEAAAKLPPGPRNPAGVVWMGLSKAHYGIHGTPDPGRIRHGESYGGIRLTNWDAADLSHMVRRGTPAILVPNPFYPAYGAGARAAGCETIYLPTTLANGFLPDLDALDAATLARTVAIFIASPANPQGAVASRDYFTRLKNLADRYGFMILSDECYSEIYTRQAPGSALECAGPDFANVVAFQSLSKRSNLPGMRVGFAAGDKKFLAVFHELRNVAAPQVPVPLQHVAVAAYSVEAHVEENRRLYRIKFDFADQILGSRYGYVRPAGGFCVWLDVSERGGDEATAVKLYRDAGVRVIPGSYLSRPQRDGFNPGAGYIRLALVSDSESTAEALHRLVETLD